MEAGESDARESQRQTATQELEGEHSSRSMDGESNSSPKLQPRRAKGDSVCSGVPPPDQKSSRRCLQLVVQSALVRRQGHSRPRQYEPTGASGKLLLSSSTRLRSVPAPRARANLSARASRRRGGRAPGREAQGQPLGSSQVARAECTRGRRREARWCLLSTSKRTNVTTSCRPRSSLRGHSPCRPLRTEPVLSSSAPSPKAAAHDQDATDAQRIGSRISIHIAAAGLDLFNHSLSNPAEFWTNQHGASSACSSAPSLDTTRAPWFPSLLSDHFQILLLISRGRRRSERTRSDRRQGNEWSDIARVGECAVVLSRLPPVRLLQLLLGGFLSQGLGDEPRKHLRCDGLCSFEGSWDGSDGSPRRRRAGGSSQRPWSLAFSSPRRSTCHDHPRSTRSVSVAQTTTQNFSNSNFSAILRARSRT